MTSLQAQVVESDSLALVALYNSTDGPNWTKQENWLNGQVGTWQGITVKDSFVTIMDFNLFGLNGTVPDDVARANFDGLFIEALDSRLFLAVGCGGCRAQHGCSSDRDCRDANSHLTAASVTAVSDAVAALS